MPHYHRTDDRVLKTRFKRTPKKRGEEISEFHVGRHVATEALKKKAKQRTFYAVLRLFKPFR